MRTLIIVTVALLYGAMLAWSTGFRPTPQCAEDQVLVGQVRFENGFWDRFECGPALDDFVTK
jgi:hypothetical protein